MTRTLYFSAIFLPTFLYFRGRQPPARGPDPAHDAPDVRPAAVVGNLHCIPARGAYIFVYKKLVVVNFANVVRAILFYQIPRLLVLITSYLGKPARESIYLE